MNACCFDLISTLFQDRALLLRQHQFLSRYEHLMPFHSNLVEKNKHVICWPRASGHTQDLWLSFSQKGPPGRQITHFGHRRFIHKYNGLAVRERGAGKKEKQQKNISFAWVA